MITATETTERNKGTVISQASSGTLGFEVRVGEFEVVGVGDIFELGEVEIDVEVDPLVRVMVCVLLQSLPKS